MSCTPTHSLLLITGEQTYAEASPFSHEENVRPLLDGNLYYIHFIMDAIHHYTDPHVHKPIEALDQASIPDSRHGGGGGEINNATIFSHFQMHRGYGEGLKRRS
ncbi:hypothetical protein CHS0354_019458 [Potamilus streckersoni]|uniref:Uncharacterized protein n=1 Tax=Potamilus streckersoni TaxID=2493646 RepID=A0AAE0SHQ7_9BIVA|nr:hypothetical protein CHS0354_019458 [Potamilus streckersoni]